MTLPDLLILSPTAPDPSPPIGEWTEVVAEGQHAGYELKFPGGMISLMRQPDHMNRGDYLAKLEAALEAGCVIVPNFPGDTIAIRTKRKLPRRTKQLTWHHSNKVHDQTGDQLPEGEGRYVSPTPLSETRELTAGEKEARQKNSSNDFEITPVAWDDDIQLPAEYLKPTIIERTGKVMARRIFDEIAISPGSWQARRGDPMVLGRVLGPNNMMTSFLVAWFIDTEDL